MASISATILTGFLGAGKTTLLNRLLGGEAAAGTAVIVNEFGDVGIDGQLVVATDETVVELANGCLCCTVRGDLVAAIHALLDGPRPLPRLIVETSGLADPAPVIQYVLMDDRLAARVALDAVVTVVDAAHVEAQIGMDEAREQIAFADLLILNKIDLADELGLARAEAMLRRINPLARLRRTREAAIAPAEVLALGAFDLANLLRIDPDLLDGTHAHEHTAGIGSVALRLDGPVDADRVSAWLMRLTQEHGRDILRLKGVMDAAGARRRLVVQGVHMTLDGRPGRPWAPGERRSSAIVFIGRNLDEAALRAGLAACAAPAAPPAALAS